MLNAFAYAFCQARTTWQTSTSAPRSICIHCGSLPWALAQRVVALPSTALSGDSRVASMDDAVAGRLRAALVVPQAAAAVAGRVTMVRVAATSAAATLATARIGRR